MQLAESDNAVRELDVNFCVIQATISCLRPPLYLRLCCVCLISFPWHKFRTRWICWILSSESGFAEFEAWDSSDSTVGFAGAGTSMRSKRGTRPWCHGMWKTNSGWASDHLWSTDPVPTRLQPARLAQPARPPQAAYWVQLRRKRHWNIGCRTSSQKFTKVGLDASFGYAWRLQ